MKPSSFSRWKRKREQERRRWLALRELTFPWLPPGAKRQYLTKKRLRQREHYRRAEWHRWKSAAERGLSLASGIVARYDDAGAEIWDNERLAALSKRLREAAGPRLSKATGVEAIVWLNRQPLSGRLRHGACVIYSWTWARGDKWTPGDKIANLQFREGLGEPNSAWGGLHAEEITDGLVLNGTIYRIKGRRGRGQAAWYALAVIREVLQRPHLHRPDRHRVGIDEPETDPDRELADQLIEILDGIQQQAVRELAKNVPQTRAFSSPDVSQAASAKKAHPASRKKLINRSRKKLKNTPEKRSQNKMGSVVSIKTLSIKRSAQVEDPRSVTDDEAADVTADDLMRILSLDGEPS